MNRAEASQFDDLIQGKCVIADKLLIVLYDLDTTHYFISFNCAKELHLPISSLSFDLIVSTPILTQ